MAFRWFTSFMVLAIRTALGGIWLAIMLYCGSADARAESNLDKLDLFDSLRGTEAASAEDDKKDPQDFEIKLSVPLIYTNNVVSVASDSLVSSSPGWYVAPDLTFKWTHQYRWFKLVAEAGAGMYRYDEYKSADTDVLFAKFKVEFTDGKSYSFVPYLANNHTMYMEPFFTNPQIDYNDYVAGFYSGVGLRRGSVIGYIDAGDKPWDSSLLLDLKAGYRTSDQNDYENGFVIGTLEYDLYLPFKEWRVEVTPGAKFRWYANYFGEQRRDWQPGLDASLVWTPDWLTKLSKRSKITFDFGLYRNYSTIAADTYSVWQIGPRLELRSRF